MHNISSANPLSIRCFYVYVHFYDVVFFFCVFWLIADGKPKRDSRSVYMYIRLICISCLTVQTKRSVRAFGIHWYTYIIKLFVLAALIQLNPSHIKQ